MDPLSLSASIITVVAATASSIKLLKKAQGFCHLPDQLCALLNEISDLRCVLRILEGMSEEEASEELRGSLTRLLRRAKLALDELDVLLRATLVTSENEEEHTKLRVSRWIWVRRQSQMKRLRAEIKDVRTCTQMTLLGINS